MTFNVSLDINLRERELKTRKLLLHLLNIKPEKGVWSPLSTDEKRAERKGDTEINESREEWDG